MYGTAAAPTQRLYFFGCLPMSPCTSGKTATNLLGMRCSSTWPSNLLMTLRRIRFGATKMGSGVFNGLARQTLSNLNSPPALASHWQPVVTGWHTLCPICTGDQSFAVQRCWMGVLWMRPRVVCLLTLRLVSLLGTAN